MRPIRMTGILVAAALVPAVLLPTTAGAAVPVARHPAVLSQAHTAGRVEVARDALRYSWPGVYFEGRFRGTGVGVVLNDAAADYDVQIDGATVATLVRARPDHPLGRATSPRRAHASGSSRGRRARGRSASSAASGQRPVARCSRPPAAAPADRVHRRLLHRGLRQHVRVPRLLRRQVNRTTNADLSFGARTARRLHADYQINAFSGRGMVRNYNGGEPGTSYRTRNSTVPTSPARAALRPVR